MEFTLSDAITEFIQQRKEAKLEPFKKARDNALNKETDEAEISAIKEKYLESTLSIEQSFAPIQWLTFAAGKASEVNFSTHSAKFINSGAKSSSCLVTDFDDSKSDYLVTANIKNKAIDVVGAGVFSIAKLMMLTVDGDSLLNQVHNNHISVLKEFTDDETLLNKWLEGFKGALVDKNKKSDNLVKQVYYPVSDSDAADIDYHMLCPLFASSLAQELHGAVSRTRFDEESVMIRKARRNHDYHDKWDTFFPSMAVQNFGGSKPQNVSLLNQDRGGKTFLLDSSPPREKRAPRPPIEEHSMFSGEFELKAFSLVRDFKIFLTGLTEKDRNFKTRYKRDYAFIERILGVLLNYVASVQNSEKYAGWSNDTECEIKREHALWLDVYSPVPEFQKERQNMAWVDVVADDFTFWLINKLQSEKHYFLGKLEEDYIRKICLHEIKQFEAHTPKFGEL